MSLPSATIDAGQDLLARAQAGDPGALADLREQYHLKLASILMARGASPCETDDVLADLWADCVPGIEAKPTLLIKFGGKFSLLSWLARVAGNRWIDLKRRGARLTVLEDDQMDALPGCLTTLADENLQALLRESLQSALAACPAEALVMLRLVYMHGLTQREVGRLFGCGESKTSRVMAQAMEQIKTGTLQALKRRDSRLELEWEDLLGLCAAEGPGFL